MKFEIGDKVVVKLTNEEAEVVEIINEQNADDRSERG